MTNSIVILGAGFGGLRCALDLARRVPQEWKVVLVDRNVYHIYYPALYYLIMPKNRQECTFEIKKILKGTRVEFVQGEVQGVDCKGRVVNVIQSKAELLPAAQHKSSALAIPYDYLVLALGAGTDYFGIAGLQEYACTLKSLEDAEGIREKVTSFLQKIRHPEAVAEGSRDHDKDEILRSAQNDNSIFSIVIGGAGATGVEVAAELAHLFQKVPRERWSVTLVEALGSVLWMFPKSMGEYAYQQITKLGVHTMLDTCIKRVVGAHSREIATSSRGCGTPRNDGGRVEVVLAPRPLKPGETEAALACDFLPEHEKRVRADLLLWAGGIRANPFLAQCGLQVDRKGRLEVDEHLQVKGMEGVFAIGDNATLLDPHTKQPVPATAQAALEQGELVVRNIMHLIQSQPLATYRFHDFPAIVPLANRNGVAIVGPRVICGLPAWFLRKVADYRYYCTIVPWWKALKRCILG